MGHIARITEAAGISTVVIGIKAFQPRLTPMRLPRTVITPHPMGRPLGAPMDCSTQTHVLKTALNLLDSASQAGAQIELSAPYRT